MYFQPGRALEATQKLLATFCSGELHSLDRAAVRVRVRDRVRVHSLDRAAVRVRGMQEGQGQGCAPRPSLVAGATAW